ncbi:MAG TPA: hypothetical protein H9666_01375 [Firmicutes bacterium]|nr:hypothetical protein [Bacillota bacterium]
MSNADFFPIERNRYFYGKLLTVRDFEIEQRYARQKSQLMNRLSLGAGVLCGLGVTASDDSTLLIESGIALDYQGRMVVLEEPILRKLQMIEGQEALHGQSTAYLCLAYDEEDLEPVNAVGADTGESRQFNMTREGSRLFLTTQAPEYRSLLEAQGLENVSVLYASEELTLVLAVPAAAYGGQEIELQVLVVKNEKTPPVSFRLEGESAFLESENGRVCLEFKESPEEKRRVYPAVFRQKVRPLSEADCPLFTAGGELNLFLGSHHYKNYVEAPSKTHICSNEAQLQDYRRRSDSLEKRLTGRDLPIYLAKLELINSAGGVFLGDVTGLPFQQMLDRRSHGSQSTGGLEAVTTSVRSLEYWQKPDVKAEFQPATKALHLDFGIPSPEQYDYAIAHGTVDLTMPGGIRVNSRVYSEEIPHGLGPGAVDVRLSLQFQDEKKEGETALLYGNSEVFRGKASPVDAPWAEAAALVYPERGTMRIGLWLHDTVQGNRMTVHYFAQKPERDTSRILAQRQVSLQLTPEFSRVSRRGTLRMEAEVVGSEDKSVTWQVKEENGGAIDRNGVYQAPETPGTYEIIATAGADETVTASAFVIVE